MALIPEEFPVVLTVFLALGAWRIARSQVLTRRAPAIEALGAATVLCVDKTGTLTENRMTVTRFVLPDESLDVEGGPVPPAFHHLIDLAFLASAVDPFDPMERAIHRLYDAKGEAMRMRHAERGTQIGARRSSPAEWGGELDRLAAGASRSVEHEAGLVEPGTGTAALGSSSAGAARM